MTRFFRFIWQRHRWLSLALVAALITCLFFVGTFTVSALYFANPANRDRALEPWMSPHYVSLSWGLSRSVTAEIMEIGPDTPRDGPRTLADVMARTGLTLDELQARVEAARQVAPGRDGR